MRKDELKALLNDIANGKISVDDAILSMKKAPFEDLGFAKPDSHRELRQGTAEVIFL